MSKDIVLGTAEQQKVKAIDNRVIKTQKAVGAEIISLGEYFIALKVDYPKTYKAMLNACSTISYEQANKYAQIAKQKDPLLAIKSVLGDTFLLLENNINKMKAVASATKKGGVEAGIEKAKDITAPKPKEDEVIDAEMVESETFGDAPVADTAPKEYTTAHEFEKYIDGTLFLIETAVDAAGKAQILCDAIGLQKADLSKMRHMKKHLMKMIDYLIEQSKD